MEEDFNEEKACEYTRKLWLRLAHRLSDDAFSCSDPFEAMTTAMMADACYWQATGVSEPISVKDFIEENKS